MSLDACISTVKCRVCGQKQVPGIEFFAVCGSLTLCLACAKKSGNIEEGRQEKQETWRDRKGML